MGLGVVADVDSARAQQSERLVEQGMLARAAVGENEIEGHLRLALDHCRGVLAEQFEPWVGPQMRPGNNLHLRTDIDAD